MHTGREVSEHTSWVMSRIRSKNTKPEMAIRKYLFAKGLRYRLHVKALPGTPDIVFRKRKLAIFVHGCFWHGHKGCNHFRMPKTRTDWWANKIARNQTNDRIAELALELQGFKVVKIWECDIKNGTAYQLLENCLGQR